MCRRPLLPLLALAALLALLPACHALSCYNCRDLNPVQSGTVGKNAPNLPLLRTLKDSESVGSYVYPCASFDTAQSKYKLDCPAPFDKSCAKVDAADGTTVLRGCAKIAADNCTKYDTGETLCVCTTDYCNSAGLTTPTLLLLLPAALMAAFYSGQ